MVNFLQLIYVLFTRRFGQKIQPLQSRLDILTAAVREAISSRYNGTTIEGPLYALLATISS